MFLLWKRLNFSFLILMLILPGLKAQENNRVKLSLNDALNLANKKNFELRLARAEIDKMSADKNKTLSVFMPQVTLSETFIKTDDPISVFGFKLKQKIISPADFNPLLLNNPNNTSNYNTRIVVKQPLINFDGFFGRAAAAEGLSAVKYKKARTEKYVRFLVKANYYLLGLQNKSLQVIKKDLQTAKANRKFIKNYYNEGLITKADYLMVEVYVSNVKSQLIETENNVKKASDNLRFVLGIKGNKQIQPVDSLTLPNVNLIDYQPRYIIENRSDILAYRYKVNALDKLEKMNWMKLLPRVNAFGAFEYNDTKFLGTQANNWLVGVNLQWNIFNGFKNIASIQKSKAELSLAETEYQKAKTKGINDINGSIRDIKAAKAKLMLAEAAVNQSAEALRIITNRYNKGLEKTIDLINIEASALNTKLNYWKTLYYYNVTVFKAELMLERKLVTN